MHLGTLTFHHPWRNQEIWKYELINKNKSRHWRKTHLEPKTHSVTRAERNWEFSLSIFNFQCYQMSFKGKKELWSQQIMWSNIVGLLLDRPAARTANGSVFLSSRQFVSLNCVAFLPQFVRVEVIKALPRSEKWFCTAEKKIFL